MSHRQRANLEAPIRASAMCTEFLQPAGEVLPALRRASVSAHKRRGLLLGLALSAVTHSFLYLSHRPGHKERTAHLGACCHLPCGARQPLTLTGQLRACLGTQGGKHSLPRSDRNTAIRLRDGVKSGARGGGALGVTLRRPITPCHGAAADSIGGRSASDRRFTALPALPALRPGARSAYGPSTGFRAP
jgi:hypothetical protein